MVPSSLLLQRQRQRQPLLRLLHHLPLLHLLRPHQRPHPLHLLLQRLQPPPKSPMLPTHSLTQPNMF